MDVLSVKLGELAAWVGGRLVDGRLGSGTGMEDLVIFDALPLQDAGEGSITLLDSPKHMARLTASLASAVVVPEVWEGCPKPMLVVDSIHAAFQKIIERLRPSSHLPVERSISERACIAATAIVGRDCFVGPAASVGENCILGDGCTIHAGVHIMADCHVGDGTQLMPGVVLYPGTRVGKRVVVHANSVLGAYGFGYRLVDGAHARTAQLGWVDVADDVEIGAGATIDRGTYGPTKIGAGSKLDNQVHVGHNCQLGRHNLICGHVGMAGSCTTGDYVVMAGQVGLADHVHIGDRSRVGAQSGLMQDVPADQTVIGSPAMPSKRKMQEYAISARLPEMRRELRDLQKQVEQLQAVLAASSRIPGEQRDAA
jgi:UDP-3-O-[3-hydroxymyristoyl] glucosamine N-acyltransferase